MAEVHEETKRKSSMWRDLRLRCTALGSAEVEVRCCCTVTGLGTASPVNASMASF